MESVFVFYSIGVECVAYSSGVSVCACPVAPEDLSAVNLADGTGAAN